MTRERSLMGGLLALLLTVASGASAQEFTGNIYGRIVDPSNAVMPGVTITVEGPAILFPRKTESEANGSYRVAFLPPGEYRVTCQKAGFKKIVYETAKVELGRDLTMNVTMQIDKVGETVVVTGSPIVDVRNATVGTTWGASFLRDIPNQRDLSALLAMTPGIAMPRPDVGGNTAGTQSVYSAYGMVGQSITTVDGVIITVDPNRLGSVGAYTDYGAIHEAKVSGAGNAADVPVAGAAVATVIRSGSNTLHGAFFADHKPGGGTRVESLTNYTADGGTRYIFAETYQQYRDINGQLGGPLIKDRLWYFTSVRDQQTTFLTGMYDRPAGEGGTQGQPFPTETSNFTLKLNYQLSRQGTLTFMTQWGRKQQPYRLGSGGLAYQYLVESTADQDSRSQISKVGYMRVINKRATLDASVNMFTNPFPLNARTDKTPIIDDVTLARSGAYNRPELTQNRRWHYNTTVNLYAGKHDMQVGYMYHWFAPRNTDYGAPGPAGTAGHFFITTTDGVPSSFSTDNGPVSNVNVLTNHALFFQDKFQVMSKLTLSYGIRFDQYNSSYPAQRFGLNGDQPCVVESADCNVGPFAIDMATPPLDVVTFNTVVPRVALIYDLFGNSKTALRASWGRFATDPAYIDEISQVNPIRLSSRKYAWDTGYLTANPEVAATRITPAYVATLWPIVAGAPLTPTALAPDLTNSYTDEYTFGIDQEIADDLRGHVTVVRKREQNTIERIDLLQSQFSSYSPVPVVDPGPDGAAGTADDRTITVWEAFPHPHDYLLINMRRGDTYTTLELGVTKRLRDNWQLVSGVDWRKRNLSQFFENPNQREWGPNTQTTGWTFKASGSYVFNYGIMVAVFFNAMKGEPYGRSFTITPQYLALADPNRTTRLRQGNISIQAEKTGTYHMPIINMINVRVQKEFVIKDSQRLHLMVNAFNISGARTVNGVIQTTGLNFNLPTTAIGERVVRFSVRYSF